MKGKATTQTKASKAVKRAAKGRQRPPKAQRKATLALNPDMVYTVDQLAEILQVSPKTARQVLRRGQIPAKKIGQEWRIMGESIKAYMSECVFLEK